MMLLRDMLEAELARVTAQLARTTQALDARLDQVTAVLRRDDATVRRVLRRRGSGPHDTQ